MNRLEGKVALVTGAGRGIGKGIALAYAGEEPFVVCTARTGSEVNGVADRIVAQGGDARAVTADVTEPDEVRRLFEVGLEGKGRLDTLVANAGRGAGADKATVAEGDPAIWRELLHVNLLGAYHCVHEAIPYLLRAEAAKIIMMGSGSRLRTPPRFSAYSAAKAGLWALTRTLASELKPHRIAVNEIIPGPVLKEHMLTPEKLEEIEDRQAIELPNGEWHKVPVLGETTFHQVHNGAATSHDGYFSTSLAEFAEVTGESYRRPSFPFLADLGERYGRMQAVGRFLVADTAGG